jgi:hypothetical protein
LRCLPIDSKKRAKRACSTWSALAPILLATLSATGELADSAGRCGHLAAVGPLGTGTNRAAPLLQPTPLAVSIDEHTTLFEDAIQQQRCISLYPRQVRDVHPAARRMTEARGEIGSGGEGRENE